MPILKFLKQTTALEISISHKESMLKSIYNISLVCLQSEITISHKEQVLVEWFVQEILSGCTNTKLSTSSISLYENIDGYKSNWEEAIKECKEE